MGGYSDTVTRLALDPEHVGDLPLYDASGLVGTPGAGRFLRFTVRLSDSRITDIGFTTYGCGPCIAAGSMMATMVLSKPLADTAAIGRDDLLAALGGLPDDKLHCADLAIAAWQDLLASVAARAHSTTQMEGPHKPASFVGASGPADRREAVGEHAPAFGAPGGMRSLRDLIPPLRTAIHTTQTERSRRLAVSAGGYLTQHCDPLTVYREDVEELWQTQSLHVV
jgi:nitrogen fixation NifU-like protein